MQLSPSKCEESNNKPKCRKIEGTSVQLKFTFMYKDEVERNGIRVILLHAIHINGYASCATRPVTVRNASQIRHALILSKGIEALLEVRN